jgi:hypothetical protein
MFEYSVRSAAEQPSRWGLWRGKALTIGVVIGPFEGIGRGWVIKKVHLKVQK